MGDLARLSLVVGGGGGGGATFFGIFFRLLIKAGGLVLFELDVFAMGDDSRRIGTFEGDFTMIDVGSSLIEAF